MRKAKNLFCCAALLLCCGFSLFPESTEKEYLIGEAAEKLQDLYRANPELSIGARTCSVGSFTWEESGIGTEFSAYLRSAVADALMRISEFDLMIPAEDTVDFGTEAQEILDRKKSRNGNVQTAAYRIFGTYRVAVDGIELAVDLYSAVFSRLMADFSLQLPLEKVPRGISLYPSNLQVLTDVSSEVGSLYEGSDDFQVFISTNRGEGSIFQEGEYLKLYLLASRDCFLKLYHIDVYGKTTLIFPNRYEKNNFLPGGDLLAFPSGRSPFQFRLVPPTGTEMIKAVASTKQFSSLEEDFSDLGPATRGIFIEGAEQETTEIMAEDLVYFTITEKE